MILDLYSSDLRLEMSKGAKKFLCDRYAGVISLIRQKETQAFISSIMHSVLPDFSAILYGAIKHVPFFYKTCVMSCRRSCSKGICPKGNQQSPH